MDSNKIKTNHERDALITVKTSTINPKYKRKYEIKDVKLSPPNIVSCSKECIPVYEKKLNKLSTKQKQENLRNLHNKTKLLLKKNLERKKTLTHKTNDNKPENISNVKRRETSDIITNEIIFIKSRQNNNSLQRSGKPNNGIIKNKNISRKLNCTKKIQTPLKDSNDAVQNIDSVNKNSLLNAHDVYYSQKLFDYPYNFISAVKNKLSITVNSPRNKKSKLLLTPLSKHASKLVPKVESIKNQEVPVVKDITNGMSQVSNVISDLKSSLSEIQNLTLFISFHDVRACQCPTKLSNSDSGKHEEKILSNSMIIDNFDHLPVLTPPNCALTPPKSYINKNMSKNIFKSEKNIFHKELSLLDSFNESLSQIQKVDEALSSIRTFSKKDMTAEEKKYLELLQPTSANVNAHFKECSTYAKLKSEVFNNSVLLEKNIKDPPKYIPPKEFAEKQNNVDLALTINPQTILETTVTNEQAESFADLISDTSNNSFLCKKYNKESFLEAYQLKKSNLWKSNNKSFVGHLCQFCICLISQNIEDEKSRLSYLTTFLKARERTLVDAARTELLCLEVQKKQYHDQIPLLKRKQRGLLLKLQQERYEIKHVKKFHLTKSHERKEALKRQLKHLKILLLVDAYNSSKKDIQLKKSTFSMTRTNSPIRGINLSDDSDILKNKISEKCDTLVDQKKKLNDLLIHYYNLQIDSLEIDTLEKRVELEKKLLRNKIDTFEKDIHKPENMNNNINMESLPIVKNVDNSENVKIEINTSTTSVDGSQNILSLKKSSETMDTNENIISKNVLLDDYKEYSISGLKLNELWGKITGHNEKKYDDTSTYNMSKTDLDNFFDNAKKIAYDNLMESLKNMPISDQKEDSKNIRNVSINSKPVLAQPEVRPLSNKTENTNESDSTDSTARSLIEELENFPNDLSHSTEGTSEISKTEISISNMKDDPCYTNDKLIKQDIPNEENISKIAEDFPTELKSEESNDVKVNEINASTEKKILKIPKKDLPRMNERQKLLTSTNFAKFDSFMREREAMHQDSLSIDRWDTMSPSPELSPHDSPTGEYSPAFAAVALSRNDEAEELRKKQLAIEKEIKALQRQQSQIPYCIVREIPDKPPPPYIPPTEESKTVNIASQTAKESISLKPVNQVINTISTMCEWIWSQLSDSSQHNTRDYHSFLKHISKKSKQMPAVHSMFLFDLCNETFEAEYKALHSSMTEPWEYQEKQSLASHYNIDLLKIVESKIRKILSIDSPKDNSLIKIEDHVEKLLVKELYEEEIHWGNVEKYEIAVKNEITNSILQSLIKEAVNDYKTIHSESSKKETG